MLSRCRSQCDLYSTNSLYSTSTNASFVCSSAITVHYGDYADMRQQQSLWALLVQNCTNGTCVTLPHKRPISQLAKCMYSRVTHLVVLLMKVVKEAPSGDAPAILSVSTGLQRVSSCIAVITTAVFSASFALVLQRQMSTTSCVNDGVC
jgi:uncharacterized protein